MSWHMDLISKNGIIEGIRSCKRNLINISTTEWINKVRRKQAWNRQGGIRRVFEKRNMEWASIHIYQLLGRVAIVMT